jgi:hypothetical protein
VMADRNSKIDQIKALLSKTVENGCTEAEYLAALNKANAMIETHGITDDELELSREEKAILHEESEADARDTHQIKWRLALSISRYCNVQVFSSRKGGLTFAGFKSDIEWAIWLLDHLADHVHRELCEFLLDCLAPKGQERKEEIRGFVIGCTGRINARLREFCEESKTQRTTNGKALVVIKDQAIKDLLKAKGITLRTSTSRARFSEGARAAGQSAGDRADFGKPVSGAGATLRLGKN